MIGGQLTAVAAVLLASASTTSANTRKFTKVSPSFASNLSDALLTSISYPASSYRFACAQQCNQHQCCCLACIQDPTCYLYNIAVPNDWSGHDDPSALTFDTCFKSADATVESHVRNCQDVKNTGRDQSGVFSVHASDCCSSTASVYCDMDTDGGGWTVMLRRLDMLPREDFYRTWEEYAQGFGDMAGGEFWLGLDIVHDLTAQKAYELRVDVSDYQGNSRYAKYSQFSIGSRTDHFPLTVGGYSGNAGDSLAYHSGQKFSAKDMDFDNSDGSCSSHHQGAWWYKLCYQSNLNGPNLGSHISSTPSMTWTSWQGFYCLKEATMMIRPVS